MLTGKERRKKILELIKNTTKPISGTELAKLLDVSRQVIVQDIALLRAEENDISSTTKGYVLKTSENCRRVFEVMHSDEDTENELNLVVDLGGTVLDVFVTHEIYGDIRANLNITSRRKVREFIEKLKTKNISPLKNLTLSKHYHTVEAESEEILNLIESELKEKKFIVE
ncbi:transcription repressor NadR [Fusobacterium sp.]|uniref:transcription repressor NadR n=1 Tax=Fusobacterium sp. TaxID=68766 RepID=UPI00345CF33E